MKVPAPPALRQTDAAVANCRNQQLLERMDLPTHLFYCIIGDIP